MTLTVEIELISNANVAEEELQLLPLVCTVIL